MARTLTELTNEALLKIGHDKPIENIDADTHPARIIKPALSRVIEEVQGLMFWPELIATITPSPSSGPDENGTYRFTIPGDLIHIVSVQGQAAPISQLYTDWKIEGQELLTGIEYPEIKYTAYNDTPAEWSRELDECIALRLAQEISFAMTQNTSINESLRKEYQLKRRTLMARRRRRTSRKESPHTWLDARRYY